MILNFLEIWIITLLAIAGTSIVALAFVLVSTGVVEEMDTNERGELRSFSMLMLGVWSVGISLLVTQVIILIA